jgi:hypothetical protein
MPSYIKVNRLVASHLGLTEIRVHTNDDCYLLWQADMLAFGSLGEMWASAARIGALVLTPQEARTEQDGTTLRELPVATDEQFVLPEQVAAEEAEADDVLPADEVEATEVETVDDVLPADEVETVDDVLPADEVEAVDDVLPADEVERSEEQVAEAAEQEPEQSAESEVEDV